MNDQKQNEIAIQRFVEYIRIKTVQPEPDYASALEFLKNYAQELGLEYQTIAAETDRHAAVLTVNKYENIGINFSVHFSGNHRRHNHRLSSIPILMLCLFSKNIGWFHHFQEKFVMGKSMDEGHKI